MEIVNYFTEENIEKFRDRANQIGLDTYVLDLFQLKGIELNEFQAKSLFLQDRAQGYTYLSYLKIVKYFLEMGFNEVSAIADPTRMRGQGVDAIISSIMQTDILTSSNTQNYRRQYLYGLADFIDQNFSDIIKIKLQNDIITLTKI